MTPAYLPSPALSRRHLLTGSTAALSLWLLGCGGGRSTATDREADESWAGSLLDPPFTKPDVQFTDFRNRPFPLIESTKDKLTVLFFGYTRCPDVCPIFLNTMAAARRSLGSKLTGLQVLFVGVDLEHDTPEALRTYLGAIDGTFIGLTGESSEIDRAISELKMAPVIIREPGPNGGDDVGHQARVFAFSPDNLSHRLYNHDVRQRQWIADLPRLARGEW
jgi:protein SCO1/2